MKNYSWYKKQIEALEVIKQNIEEGKIFGYKDYIEEFFYDGEDRLKADFLEIIPIEELANVKQLLKYLQFVTLRFRCGKVEGVSSKYGRDKKKDEVLNDISGLQGLICKQCRNHGGFGVFYSWQSDSDSENNRSLIEEAIERAIEKINENGIDKPLLWLDKDTRRVPGSPDITPTLLNKIDNSICFIADVTPIVKVGDKEVSNPNVMFELGYAVSSLRQEKVVLVCNTIECDVKNLPFDLRLKRVVCYRYSKNMTQKEKDDQKDELINKLMQAIKDVVDD